ncbi:subtilisin-like serine protease precursor [Vairimorpha apis BRL 01]|uniref:Subtilisin-like serine protease n=1 Tax=Vairimorpha apis BRL 01 TaxID=1037528 RepID=T0L820_9MICR|nr:subtilisin-like serine protease precursor [Vairimorpha apis BRL 01]
MVLFKKNTNLSRAEALQQTEQNIYRISKYFSPSSYIESNISNGFIGKLDEETANKLKNDNQVAIVEKDQTIKIASLNIFDFEQTENVFKVQNNAPWGLSRVLGKPYLKSHEYLYNETIGQDVEVYVIDTGVHVTHKDFGGRARWGANFVNTINKDENGHGTHVAGIIGGKTYGINKNVDIVAVKVLDRMGSGMISSIMKGIDYVIKEHEEKKIFCMTLQLLNFYITANQLIKRD